KAMEADFPEVEMSVKFTGAGEAPVRIGDKVFMQDGMLWAEPEMLTMFDFDMMRGDSRTALAEPSTIVLAEPVAKRFFGEEDPIGKTMLVRDQYEVKVTGVYKELPKQSHFRPLMIASFATYAATRTNPNDLNWGNSSYYTHVLLREGARPEDILAKFPAFTEKYMGALFKEWGRTEPRKYLLQPLVDIHLHSSHINFDIGKNGNINTLFILSALALVILFTACINYMNLATARASLRAKEVGVRKVVGAERTQIMLQFLGESLVFTAIAALIAAILIEFSLPVFSSLVEREFDASLVTNVSFLWGFALVSLITGIMAGSYPAFVLARFQPVSVLKGQTQKMHRSQMRNALVVIQFAASITLVICLLAIVSQMNFVQTKDVGYQREQIVTMDILGTENVKKALLFKEQASRQANIIGASISTMLPVRVGSMTGIRGTDEEGNEKPLRSYQIHADGEYLNLFGIRLVAGNDITMSRQDGYVVNEAFVRHFGWKGPIGKTFIHNDELVSVVGVVKDFHMHSMHEPIGPVFIKPLAVDWATHLAVKIRTENVGETINQLQKIWEQLIPGRPFRYSFLDEQFNQLYQDDRRFAQIVTYAAVLAIVVASLGLFGLAAFIIEQRRKEIGVRKILGASLSAIILTLSKEFMTLVGIANLVAWPLGYYLMDSWLENFAYRIDLGIGVFLLAGFGALATAFVTVSFQSVRAATANPVEALRYE
ncbi:MAG TPA: FtsX-like permease family protein, partial [Bacteroidota bacterium]